LESTKHSVNTQNQKKKKKKKKKKKNYVLYTNKILNVEIKNKNMEKIKYFINSNDYKLTHLLKNHQKMYFFFFFFVSFFVFLLLQK